MYYNYLCGYQSALMAPTEILAVQHYNNLKNRLFGLLCEYEKGREWEKFLDSILIELK